MDDDVAPPLRVMFIRCDPWEYCDWSNFNSFFMKAAFPSTMLESKFDWSDRVFMTRNADKAWRFETALLADLRSSVDKYAVHKTKEPPLKPGRW